MPTKSQQLSFLLGLALLSLGYSSAQAVALTQQARAAYEAQLAQKEATK